MKYVKLRSSFLLDWNYQRTYKRSLDLASLTEFVKTNDWDRKRNFLKPKYNFFGGVGGHILSFSGKAIEMENEEQLYSTKPLID